MSVRPLDPDALRSTAGRLELLVDGASWLALPAVSWTGPGSEAHSSVAARLCEFQKALQGDLDAASSQLCRLASAAEDCRLSVSRQEAQVAEAERVLANAVAAGNDAAVALETSRLASTRAGADRAIASSLEAFAREDREVSRILDSLATRPLVLDIRPLFAHVPGVGAGIDALSSSLTSLYGTNRTAMRRHAEGALTERIDRLETVRDYLRYLHIPAVDLGLLEGLRAHRDRLLAWSDSDRQFLEFDPAGDGRIVEVFGDIDTAEHVAVVVPGITNSQFTYQRYLAGPAARLQDGDPDVAVVAWLGYDTPGAGPLGDILLTFDAIGVDAALDGADELATFVEWLAERRPDAHRTVVAHSYGTVVAAIAASESLAVDDLVLLGSPGVPVARADAFDLEPGADVWVGLAPWDPIDELGALPAFGGSDDHDGDPQRLIHGANPMHDAFGATAIDFSYVSGHAGYFAAAGIPALRAVITRSVSPRSRDGE